MMGRGGLGVTGPARSTQSGFLLARDFRPRGVVFFELVDGFVVPFTLFVFTFFVCFPVVGVVVIGVVVVSRIVAVSSASLEGRETVRPRLRR